MEIILEISARKYIVKNSDIKAVTLGVGHRDAAHCGCSAAAGVYPKVKLGVSPFDVTEYNKAIIDGVEIYYPDSVLNTFRNITIKVEGLLFYKQLLALGR